MKYLILLSLLSGCSLIKINEAASPPKSRPNFIGVTEVLDSGELQTRIQVSEILAYFDNDNQMCRINMKNGSVILTNSKCNSIDGLLNQ